MEKLQYISQGNTKDEQLLAIHKVLDNGAKWVQVRWKNAPEHALVRLCENARQLCSEYHAVCIINDHVQVAKDIDADGVHLGLDDMSIIEARQILGDHKIMGGTANTFAHVIQRMNESCDYIGLGPLRFTATKEKLSPVLGFEGYQTIIQNLKEASIAIPKIYAIGGVTIQDIDQLIHIGLYGAAVSGQITETPSIINEFKMAMK